MALDRSHWVVCVGVALLLVLALPPEVHHAWDHLVEYVVICVLRRIVVAFVHGFVVRGREEKN